MDWLAVQKIRDNAKIPKYQTELAAGMDLHACIDYPVCIEPGDYMAIPTGIAIQLPLRTMGQITGRSGLAFTYGIICITGTIDADYRGEIKVLLYNISMADFVVEPGDRIAQLVVTKINACTVNEVKNLTETVRGSNGFGHTGYK